MFLSKVRTFLLIEKDNWTSLKGLFLKFLTLCSFFYLGVINIRHFIYRFKTKSSFDCSIVSVGNLTAGGTGKTPLVIWLANFFITKGLKTGVVLRGYGRKNKSKNPFIIEANKRSVPIDDSGDEAALIKESCRGVCVAVTPDRKLGIQRLLDLFNVDVVILDDAFQRLDIEKDFDLVCLDTELPLGNGSLFPRGILRDPIKALLKGDGFIFVKGHPSEESLDILIKESGILRQKVYQCEYLPTQVLDGKNHELTYAAEDFKKYKCLLVSGIGNPESFEKTMRNIGLNVELFTLNDHHVYEENDFQLIADRMAETSCEWVLTTEKDAVKWGVFSIPFNWGIVRTELRPSAQFIELCEGFTRKNLGSLDGIGYDKSNKVKE